MGRSLTAQLPRSDITHHAACLPLKAVDKEGIGRFVCVCVWGGD